MRNLVGHTGLGAGSLGRPKKRQINTTGTETLYETQVASRENQQPARNAIAIIGNPQLLSECCWQVRDEKGTESHPQLAENRSDRGSGCYDSNKPEIENIKDQISRLDPRKRLI
jgi:hypothetical protein